jgi:hypothetical protein
MLHRLLTLGVQCAGGFPLWLVGGSDAYSDIDLYTNDNLIWDHAIDWLHPRSRERSYTRHTIQYTIDTTVFQLVRPGWKWFTNQELIEMSDLSPSACVLYLNAADNFEVDVLYPEDIRNRVCRVLIEHEFTDYRVDSYRKRGYTIVR